MRIRTWIKSSIPEIRRDPDLRLSALMRAAQAGDRDAYVELLHACSPLIDDVAHQTGASGAKRDDILRETLIAVHRVRHTYDPSLSFTKWLGAIACHIAIHKVRGRRRSSTG
jgi:DNA-directed RNA polymerase specialized sigma24 family protein